jgi:N-acyl-D-aspartate/D-glutamate deacylase
MLNQGVTTILGGNCGASLAPLVKPSDIQAIRKWADPSEINVNWASFGEFLENLETLGLGVNFGSLVGYGMVRRGVMADASKPANPEERAKIEIILKSAMKEGAFGLSSGLAYSHEKYASAEELLNALRLVGENKGVYSVHLWSEGRDLLGSINNILQLARDSGASIHISHLKAIGKKTWPDMAKALSMIDRAKSSGADISFDIFPYRRTGSLLYLFIPSWARDGGFDRMFQRFRDAATREKIKENLKAQTLHYENILVAAAKNMAVVGRTIKELSDSMNSSPEDTILDLLLANEGRVTIFGRTLAAKNIALGLKHESSMISSDGEGYGTEERKTGNLVHPRSFGTFAHFLHHFVRDKKILGWEEGIKKITAMPAKKFGIMSRGVLEKNYFADIVLFNPAVLKDNATYENPFHYPSGIEFVLVNGRIAAEKGKVTGIKSGKILRRSS